jgi:hypothetical protein
VLILCCACAVRRSHSFLLRQQVGSSLQTTTSGYSTSLMMRWNRQKVCSLLVILSFIVVCCTFMTLLLQSQGLGESCIYNLGLSIVNFSLGDRTVACPNHGLIGLVVGICHSDVLTRWCCVGGCFYL